ncbi:nitrilase-related carbon-nitrogen hydrolase [Bacteroidota bacterium]
MKKYKNVLWVLLAIVCLILQSPKLMFAPAAWLAPVFLLLISRYTKWLKGSLLIVLSLVISGIVGKYDVWPMPLPILILSVVIGSVLDIIPFLADKFFLKNNKGFWRTLIFPAAFILREYYRANAGVWTSISGTQHGFLPLVQTASIVGIWGVVFFVYWFPSVTVFVLENWTENRKKAKRASIIFISIFSIVLIFGLIRLIQKNDAKTVKVAAVAGDNSSVFETIYKSSTGNEIHFGSEISPADPELMKINTVLVEFLSDADNDKFIPVKSEMTKINDKAFEKSKIAAQKGSKIILWSEGLGITMLDDKPELIKKGQQFAKENNVYLLLAYAALFEGAPKPGEAIYENRVITINTNGEIINTFDKNVPVPNVERSAPGDGTIPVIKTEFANISPSICYDADFPNLISQTGKSETEILLIPTSDWKAISPFHSYITRFRAIENGVSVVKSTNKGLSVAYDQYGRVIGKSNFFDKNAETLIVDMPVYKVKTLFPIIGDLFAQIWSLFFIVIFIIHIFFWIKRMFIKRKTNN